MNRVLSSLTAALVTATAMAGQIPTDPQAPQKSAPQAPQKSAWKTNLSPGKTSDHPSTPKPGAPGAPSASHDESRALLMATARAVPVPTNPQAPQKSAWKTNLFPGRTSDHPSTPKPGAPGAPGASHDESKPYQIGIASWYGKQFHGKTTANGEDFDMFELTAAHLELPLGSYVKVTNLRNGRWVIVRINDRGPYIEGRIIDLSYGAARMLNFYVNGLERVRIDVLHAETVAMIQSH